MDINYFQDNLVEQLAHEVREEMNSSGSEQESQAFNRVISRWLGYELDDDAFIDGMGDRGIDFWSTSESGFDIFQVKTHKMSKIGDINMEQFDNDGVNDLHRIRTFLTENEGITQRNKGLKAFKHNWDHMISSKRLDDTKNPSPIIINLYLVIAGKGLSKPAEEEFNAFQRSLLSPIQKDENVQIQIRAVLYTIEDILKAKWRETNRTWRDSLGNKKNFIKLHPENKQWLKTSQSSVFYCRAIDLVHAYQEFGYQIFEPNVRCNIKKSKINSAIRESVKSPASRKEFRYLNNGVTIICDNYRSPRNSDKKTKNQSDFFKVIRPGIVNGLQTVVSMHDAYRDLKDIDKKDFEKNCYVLIRLLQEKAVKDADQVVRATNTQNHMQSRNLLSNRPEQILFEKKFAEFGWFYERKQDAWFAYEMDPKRWRSLQNIRKDNFIPYGKKKPRRVDNEQVAQAWFSFIGFSNHAVHEKSHIFETSNWYELLFLRRPQSHAADIDFDVKKMISSSKSSAPNAQLLLIAFIARMFAKEITPSARENKENAVQRLKLDRNVLTREQIEAELSQDDEFLRESALIGMSYTFVEYLGYVLFRSLGKDIYTFSNKILKNGTINYIKEKGTIKEIQEQINTQEFDENDILCVIWYSFKHCIQQMMGGGWKNTFQTATNRSRLIAKKETRKQIFNQIEGFHKYVLKVQFTELWSRGVMKDRGFYGFIEDAINSTEVHTDRKVNQLSFLN